MHFNVKAVAHIYETVGVENAIRGFSKTKFSALFQGKSFWNIAWKTDTK